MASVRAIEDYLKVIYSHTEWQPKPITSSQLAARLGLAPSSVSEMVKKLAGQDLVHHEPYGAISLTERGRAEALRMIRRHRLVETWLVRQFGYGWDEVHDEAEVLEHAISDRLLDAIDEQLGRPERDPHGDPIPDADGMAPQPPTVLLAEARVGFRGHIVRVSDRDPELLRTADALGLRPGTSCVLLPQVDAAVGLEVDGRRVEVAGPLATSIWLIPG